MIGYAALALLAISIAAYYFSRARAVSTVSGKTADLHSLPAYHGFFAFLCTGLVGFVLLIVLNVASASFVDSSLRDALPAEALKLPKIKQDFLLDQARAKARNDITVKIDDAREKAIRDDLAAKYQDWTFWRQVGVGGVAVAFALIVFALSYFQVGPQVRARNRTEGIIYFILALCAGVALLTTIGILGSLIGHTVNFFSDVPLYKFLFGTKWSPLSGVFEGKVDEDTVGAIPLFAGTFMIAMIAMLVAVPIGLMAAIYLSDYASVQVRTWAKPILEVLAGIPTVVYGFFAAITVAPLIRHFGESIGLDVASESVLAAGVVMGIMIIPFISSLSDDVINAVPNALRDGSYGIGATKAETITKVVLPAALPGIVSAILLGFSRAVGETMIVVMAAGQGANLTWNPLEAMTTVTVQIVALITGDTEADTAAGPAFALGFTLFVVTLAFNIVALRIVQKYRQKYD